MEAVYSSLTTRALEVHHSLLTFLHGNHRTLIALAGPPGSGKSTIAAEVVARLNSQSCLVSTEEPSSAPFAVMLPMDGFYTSRSSL